jgi:hypothetical protein
MDRQWNFGCGLSVGRKRSLRLAEVMLLGLLLLAPLSGCQIVIGVLTTLQGFPKDDADFKKQTNGRRLDEKGKKVAILSTSESSAQSELPSLDLDVIAELTRRFQAQKIKVVDSHKINNWIDDNGGISDASDLAEIGPKFGADFIVLIKFNDFGFLEENSRNLYRGHAAGTVVVVELKPAAAGGKPVARQIYHRPFDSKYPLHQPISADQEKPSLFKQRYLSRLSEELARLFYDHRPGEEM